MIENEIHILHLEDDVADARLIQAMLEAADVPCRITRVQSREEFERELSTGGFDLILADYKLPAYDGISALRWKLDRFPDVPLIFISGTIGEEAAIDGLTEGATDYVLKHKLSRLVPAIKRAMSEAHSIRERKRAEEALRQSEHRKSILNEVASMYLSAPDREVHVEVLSFLIDLVSSRVGSFGYLDDDDELVVPSFEKGIWKAGAESGEPIVFSSDSWRESRLGEAILRKETLNLSAPFTLPGERVQTAYLIVVPIIFGNETIGVLCFGRDESSYEADDSSILEEIARFISPVLNARMQRDRHERIRRKTELELIAAKEKAEENDRLKTAFLQNISHEIRTPMNAICGFAYLLKEHNVTEEQRNNFVNIIQSSSNQLLSVITDILTISSLETGQLKVNLREVFLSEVICELLALFQSQAAERNVRLFSNQQHCDQDLVIETDRGKLMQILTNLVSNAIKFTRNGLVEFGFSLEVGTSMVEFFVKDNGIGIKEEFQEVIFERFRQADEGMRPEYGGTGLGLSISKGLVELMGGRVWVTSAYGSGSTFYFTIPCRVVRGMERVRDLAREAWGEAKTVLLVEDKEYNYLFLEEILKSMNCNVIHAWDGREAVAVCENNRDVELVLMDIKMPFMDGYEAARRIKEIRPSLPIVAQTAYAMHHEKEKYRGVFDDYITKPIDKGDMIKRISKY